MNHETGTKLKLLRLQRGLTLQDLVGDYYSITYLSRVESNDIQPSERFLDYVLDKLKVNREIFEYQPTEKDIHDIFKRFNKEKRLSSKEFTFLSYSTLLPFSPNVYIQIYTTLIRYYLLQNDVDRANDYYIKSKVFVNNTVDSEILGYYYATCGSLHVFFKEYHEAELYYGKSLDQLPESEFYAGVLYNMSLTKKRTSDFRISLSYSLEALKLYKKYKNEYQINKTLILIGHHYYYLDQYKDAEEALVQARDYMIKVNDLEMLSKAEYGLAKLKRKFVDYESARLHYDRYAELLDELNLPQNKVFIYRDLAFMYLESKQLDKVNTFTTLFFEIAENHRFPDIEVEIYYALARSYKIRGFDDEYERYMKLAFQNSLEANFKRQMKEYGVELGHYYYNIKKYKKVAEIFVKLHGGGETNEVV